MPGMYKYSMEIESNVKKLLLDTKELQDKMDTLEGKEYKINLNIDEKKLGNVISNLEKMLDSLGKGTGDFKQFENLSKELSSIVSEVQSLSKAFGKVDDSGAKTLLSSIQNIDKSLSELSQNILNVNKNMSNMGGNTSGAVKQVENISDAYQNAAKEAEKLADAQSKIGQKTNISSVSNPAIEQQNKLQEELKETQQQAEETKSALNDLSNIKGLKHYTDEVFDKFDNNMFGSGIGENRLGKAAYFFDEKNSSDWEAIGEYSKYLTTWSAEQVKIFDQTLGFTEEQINQIIKEFYSDVDEDIQEDYKFDLKNIMDEDLYEFKSKFGIELQDVMKSLGYDALKTNSGEYAFYNTDKLVREVQVYDQEANKIIDINNKVKESIKETSSDQTKDAFPDKDISASVDSATNSIKEENNVLEQNTQKVKENTQAKEQNANVNFNKYDKRLDSYNGKIDKYKTTIDRFNDGGWTSDEYLKNVQAVKDAVKEYETLLNELKGKDASLVTSDDINRLDNYEKKIKDTIATVTNMSAAEKGYNFVSGQKELDKIHKLLNENSKMSSEAKAKIRAYYTEIESGNPSMSLDRIHGEIMKIYNAEVEAGRAGRSFFDTLKNSGFHQLAAQMSGMFGFYDVINLIKQAASAVTELNTQITELAKVSEDSVSQIYADFDSYANIAKEMGSTISDTIAATTAWSKNGYNIPDSKELAEVSLLYKNVGDGINIDEANESLVSTLKGFKLEADQAEHIVDVFNEVSNREPISSSGIGEALQRSAASFNAANTSLEKSVALVTATNSVLQDPEKVGNMWKTVSARIRGAKTELEEAGEDTDGMVESTSKLQALIKGMTGFDIMKSDGKTFKDIYDIIIGIGEKWQDLNDVDRASLLEKLAGKNQSNALAAAISQVDVLKKAYGEATNAEGSAREENSKYQQSVQYSIDQTKAKLEELANDTLNSKFLKGLINAGGKIIDILDIIIKNVGILKPLLAGLAIKNIVQNFD